MLLSFGSKKFVLVREMSANGAFTVYLFFMFVIRLYLTINLFRFTLNSHHRTRCLLKVMLNWKYA